MRILNCFLVEDDLEKVPQVRWTDVDALKKVLPFIGKIINPYDECGLELSRRYKTDHPETNLTAVSLSNDDILDQSQMLMAIGFDQCIWLCPKEKKEPIAVDTIISWILDQEKFDLIIFGTQAMSGGSETTGYRAGCRLNIPCYSHVVNYFKDDEGMKIQQKTGDEKLIERQITMSAVLIVENPVAIGLQAPTLKARFKFSGYMPKKIMVDCLPERKAHILKSNINIRSCKLKTIEEIKREWFL